MRKRALRTRARPGPLAFSVAVPKNPRRAVPRGTGYLPLSETLEEGLASGGSSSANSRVAPKQEKGRKHTKQRKLAQAREERVIGGGGQQTSQSRATQRRQIQVEAQWGEGAIELDGRRESIPRQRRRGGGWAKGGRREQAEDGQERGCWDRRLKKRKTEGNRR